jgi:hypothetical protein
MHRLATPLVVSLALLAPLACARISNPPRGAPGELETESLTMADTLPLAWGKLVSVTPSDQVDRLWFQNDSGEIRIVTYIHDQNRFWSMAPVIRRK